MEDERSDTSFDEGLAAYLRDTEIDDDVRVERVVKESAAETTEIVYLLGAAGSEIGPFVRKTFPGSTGERAVGRGYELLFRAQQEGRRFAHLPAIYRYIDQENQLVVLMEYVHGRTLAEWVADADAERRTLIALIAIPQLCEALTELHTGMDESVVHRDVKPSNIMCTGTGEVPESVVLVDLGVSRAYRLGAATDTRHFGTDGFAAPEQYGFRQTDARTDVFAAGMTLAYCLLGHLPTEGDVERGFAGICRDQRLCTIVRRATAFDPDDRYQTAEALRWALASVASDVEEGEGHRDPLLSPHAAAAHAVARHVTAPGTVDSSNIDSRGPYSTVPSQRIGPDSRQAMRLDDARTGEVVEFCPKCGAILGAQPGFEDNNGFWVCRACGQQLYGEGVYDGNRYPGVMWYCDQCGDLLNAQDGFDDIRDSWRCVRCGYVNRIAPSEIDG